MPSISVKLKHPAGLWYHGFALLYVALAYVLGWWGLFAQHWGMNLVGVLLLGHAMTIAAYLVHECAHNTIFRKRDHNARLGSALTWICGASYGTFADIRRKHYRHHVENDDVVWFDYEQFFRDHPLVYRLTCALEWCYIPAHELLMHGVMAFGSFVIPERRDQRRHNLTSLLLRGGLFLALLWYVPKVALLYAVAYMIMLTVLRFMDGLQHDYGYHTCLFGKPESQHIGDLDWEQEHTFSNVISWRWQWPNWLVLNFGYHNAHHARPTTPWYRLPALHRELFGDDPATVIPLWPQLVMFHRHRVSRILHTELGEDAPYGRPYLLAAQRGEVDGGNAASFLTAF